MRFFKKLIAVLMALSMLLSVPISAQAFTSGNIFGLGTITHQDKYKNYNLYQGVDISYHNGTVNWAKMKAAGVDFVILRAGNRFVQSGNLRKDPQFDNYIKGASAQGLKIGVYFFSQAITVAEAKEEAKHTLEYIAPYKDIITLPVVFDYEFYDGGRLNKAYANWAKSKRKSIMTSIAEGFCSTVEAAGYDAMIYASKYFFYDNLNYQQLEKKYQIWLAHYTKKTDYTGKINYWQYSSDGRISGVSGAVDTNFLYALPEVEDIPDCEYTGSAVEPELKVSDGFADFVKGKDYTVTFSNNVEYGVATAVVKGLGKYAATLNKTLNFNIVPKTVHNITFTDKDTHQFTVNWDKTDDADGYQLAYVTSSGQYNVIRRLDAETNFAKITTVNPAITYSYSVRGYKVIDGVTHYGAYSEVKKVVTPPDKITNLVTESRTNKKIKLKWDKMGSSDKYYVYQYDNAKKAWVYIATAGKGATYTVKNLNANTDYKYCVKAVKFDENNQEMRGVKSDTLKTFTAPTPTKLKSLTAQKGRKLKVKWKKINGNVKGYQVMWSTSKNFTSNVKTVDVPASANTTTLQAYYAKKKYYVRVRVYTERNGVTYYSAWSTKLSVKSKK